MTGHPPTRMQKWLTESSLFGLLCQQQGFGSEWPIKYNLGGKTAKSFPANTISPLTDIYLEGYAEGCLWDLDVYESHRFSGTILSATKKLI
jgi:hypothetical protein